MSNLPPTEVFHYSCYEAPSWVPFSLSEITCFRREDLSNQRWFDLIKMYPNIKAHPSFSVAYQGTSVNRAVSKDKMEIEVLKKHFGNRKADIRVVDVFFEPPLPATYTYTHTVTVGKNEKGESK